MAFFDLRSLEGAVVPIVEQFVNRRDPDCIFNQDDYTRTQNGIVFTFWLDASISGDDVAYQDLDMQIHLAFFGSCSVRYAVTNRGGDGFYLKPTGHNPGGPRFEKVPMTERVFRAVNVPAEAWQWGSDHDSAWRMDGVGGVSSSLRSHLDWQLRDMAGVSRDVAVDIRAQISNEQTFGAFKFVRITTKHEDDDGHSHHRIQSIQPRDVEVVTVDAVKEASAA